MAIAIRDFEVSSSIKLCYCIAIFLYLQQIPNSVHRYKPSLFEINNIDWGQTADLLKSCSPLLVTSEISTFVDWSVLNGFRSNNTCSLHG